MNNCKSEEALQLLKKAQKMLEDCEKENLKKASDYLKRSIREISRS